MKGNKIHITIAMAILSLMIIAGCSRSIDYNDGEPVMFSELPKEVQDTLIWWGEQTIVSLVDTVVVELDNVICFESDYTFLRSTFGPWITSRGLRRNSDGKEWKFSGNLNVPTPIVTIGDTIYIPSDYNLVTCGEVDPDAVFYRQTLN
ncbi:hypothetical protein [uncultured Phocaeicola sp.]|uniref:hypothetical protein n=1 Tax=uncultured Phocaeicola sp. TaxID=990718 RepID=UPI0025A61F8F|nr:hypothetical protein [uncultured Phocaeicola sp.]